MTYPKTNERILVERFLAQNNAPKTVAEITEHIVSQQADTNPKKIGAAIKNLAASLKIKNVSKKRYMAEYVWHKHATLSSPTNVWDDTFESNNLPHSTPHIDTTPTPQDPQWTPPAWAKQPAPVRADALDFLECPSVEHGKPQPRKPPISIGSSINSPYYLFSSPRIMGSRSAT